jgi:hypothetical protein
VLSGPFHFSGSTDLNPQHKKAETEQRHFARTGTIALREKRDRNRAISSSLEFVGRDSSLPEGGFYRDPIVTKTGVSLEVGVPDGI